MPDVGVISFLHNDNYGSTLQAWSLQQALTRLGYTAAHLDYRPDLREKVFNLIRSGNSPKLIAESFRKSRVKATERGAAEKAAAFRSFQQKELRLLGPCRNERELAAAAKDCGTLICGSDQVWSPEWLNRVYFLTFARGDQRRVAYACSLGVSALPTPRKQRMIRSMVQGFHAVSVREEEGRELLGKMAPGLDAALMPDPVFLTPRNDWKAFANPVSPGGGLVCYILGENQKSWNRVAEISSDTRMPVTVIPVGALSYLQTYVQAAGIDPKDWLGLLCGADQICTDSFHCAAFAILLGIPVTILRRYRDGSAESKNSRIDQLLRSIGQPGADTVYPSAEIDEAVRRMWDTGLAWLEQALRG